MDGKHWLPWVAALFSLVMALVANHQYAQRQAALVRSFTAPAEAKQGPPTAPSMAREGLPLNNPAGIRWQDRRRDKWQQPEKVIAAIGLKPGDVVADVAAEWGYWTWLLSAAVGPTGTVYAVDIDPAARDFLRARIQAEPPAYQNIREVLSKMDDICLPEGCLDYALLCEAHFPWNRDYPREAKACLTSLYRAIKPGGSLAVIEGRSNPDRSIGALSFERLREPFEAVGFRFDRKYDFLYRRPGGPAGPDDLQDEHFVIFRRP